MHAKDCLLLSLFSQRQRPLWSQVEPSASGWWVQSLDDSRMMTPPPVSRDAYPVVVGLKSAPII